MRLRHVYYNCWQRFSNFICNTFDIIMSGAFSASQFYNNFQDFYPTGRFFFFFFFKVALLWFWRYDEKFLPSWCMVKASFGPMLSKYWLKILRHVTYIVSSISLFFLGWIFDQISNYAVSFFILGTTALISVFPKFYVDMNAKEKENII